MPPLKLAVTAPSFPAQVGFTGLVNETLSVLFEFSVIVVSLLQLFCVTETL